MKTKFYMNLVNGESTVYRYFFILHNGVTSIIFRPFTVFNTNFNCFHTKRSNVHMHYRFFLLLVKVIKPGIMTFVRVFTPCRGLFIHRISLTTRPTSRGRDSSTRVCFHQFLTVFSLLRFRLVRKYL